MDWHRLICAHAAIRLWRCILPVFAVLLSLGADDAKAGNCSINYYGKRPAELVLRDRLCRVLEAFRQKLAECELAPLDSVTFHVVDSLPPRRGDPLAAYDATSDVIVLMPPEMVERALTARSAYRGLPPDALYDSLVAHELAHAYVARMAPHDADYPMAQEYVSYVLQIEAMPQSARQMLLERFPQSEPVEASELNLFAAQAAPIRFGTKAWRHYAQPGGGCQMLQRVLRGEPVFPRAD